MIFLNSLRNFIQNLNRQEMIRYGALYVGICLSGVILIIVRHQMTSNEWYQKLTQLNKARGQVQQIFTKFNTVQQQKNKVDEALKQNKSFNIQKYFQDLITQQHLTPQVTSKFSYEKLPNGYIQESLAVNCAQISTKQLCELIVAIENQPLMYIISVDITRLVQAKKINVNLIIGTLRAEE
jgi:hypothetical protein